jgi:hypothetical protein
MAPAHRLQGRRPAGLHRLGLAAEASQTCAEHPQHFLQRHSRDEASIRSCRAR